MELTIKGMRKRRNYKRFWKLLELVESRAPVDRIMLGILNLYNTNGTYSNRGHASQTMKFILDEYAIEQAGNTNSLPVLINHNWQGPLGSQLLAETLKGEK